MSKIKQNKTLKSLGEFGLIDFLTKDFKVFNQNIKIGIGDDAAVIERGKNKFEVITTDTLVENDHFNLNWSNWEQIGKKAMEVNISDVVAMGARPTYALVSLVITKNTKLAWLKSLYAGMKKACAKNKISLIGGDTTHGSIHMITVVMAGDTDKKNLCLRRDAKTNDLICATGQVGGSSAGYFGFKNNKKLTPYIKKRHLEPKARVDIAHIIAPLANAMIDVSDGVGSEARHIAEMSQKGAIVYAEKIPVHKDVFKMEEKLGFSKYKCALSGGEDFELLFTISKNNLEKLLKKNPKLKKEISIIGKITKNKKQLDLVLGNGEIKKIPGGWDHILFKE